MGLTPQFYHLRYSFRPGLRVVGLTPSSGFGSEVLSPPVPPLTDFLSRRRQLRVAYASGRRRDSVVYSSDYHTANARYREAIRGPLMRSRGADDLLGILADRSRVCWLYSALTWYPRKTPHPVFELRSLSSCCVISELIYFIESPAIAEMTSRLARESLLLGYIRIRVIDNASGLAVAFTAAWCVSVSRAWAGWALLQTGQTGFFSLPGRYGRPIRARAAQCGKCVSSAAR